MYRLNQVYDMSKYLCVFFAALHKVNSSKSTTFIQNVPVIYIRNLTFWNCLWGGDVCTERSKVMFIYNTSLLLALFEGRINLFIF